VSRRLGIGFKLRPEKYSIDVQRAAWEIADAAGFDHIWSYDHLVAVGANVAAPIFEGWALLAAMAEGTTRARIGLMVTGNQYRHPSHLAKIATTVDHLSGGRLEVGLGAGWNEPEFEMLGMPIAALPARIAQLEEACRVIKMLWTEDRATFTGRYYTLAGAIAEPKPVQKPHPPLWIGGSGPKRTLRVVAKHANVWNTNGKTLEDDVRSSTLLDRHCRDVGRDPNEIRRSAQLVWEDPVKTCRRAEEYVRAGFTEIIIVLHPDRMPEGADPIAMSEVIAAQALPRLRSLG
jgi:F420-dependent oxidoreductase-like protein